MLNRNQCAAIISLMRREVVPATGCTEPVAVALAVSRAAEEACLHCNDDRNAILRIDLRLSGNIIKNAMGVGIPGTGMTGLPIAVALGAIHGQSLAGLEVLSGLSDEKIATANALVARQDVINIEFEDSACDKLYIDARVTTCDGIVGRAMIVGAHTRFVLVERNGETILDETRDSGIEQANADPELNMAMVWDFAMNTPIDELGFILEARRLNKAAAEQAMIGKYGHQVGRTLHCARQRDIMGDSIFSRILSYTSAACDARMGGATVAVMSNSGSGNQGIAATMPVVVYAEEIFADEQATIQSHTLSHLTVIYIKQSLGRLSALCGCVVAATGSAAALCYLMGGNYEQVCGTIKNMAATITGMICDGAKASCSLKLTSGVSTAVMSAMIAMEGHTVGSLEGIIDDDVDRTIANLTLIGREAMTQTDATILRIMTKK